MTQRDRVQQRRLDEIEDEFQVLLIACLRESSQGRWGLFGQNDHLGPELRYLDWPEAKRLKELAQEIRSLRMVFGQANKTCEQFLHLCSLHGPNVRGEPRLAAEFLAEISRD